MEHWILRYRVEAMVDRPIVLAKTVVLAVVLFGCCALLVGEPLPESELEVKYVEVVSREEFKKRLADWRQYLEDHPMAIPPYEYGMDSKEFQRLLELGPGAIPWLVEELEEECDGRIFTAMELLLRAEWDPEAEDDSKDMQWEAQCKRFSKWWATAKERAPEIFEKRNRLFRSEMEGDTRSLRRIVAYSLHWDRLAGVGVPGVPLVMKRIEVGTGDEADFALMDYWTTPPHYVEYRLMGGEGIPEPPNPFPKLTDEENSASYWLDWWAKYKQHFWWLLPDMEAPE